MQPAMLCGYRRTGKDSLAQILNNDYPGGDARFHWRVYRRPDSKASLPGSVHYQGCAFAYILKQESAAEYNIPLVVADSEKDVPQFTHYRTGETVSARDIYIEWGAIRREQDPNYWCKKVCETFTDSEKVCYIVTDWRFRNEIEYVKSVTGGVTSLRIYRSEVPVPPLNIPSEHDLDGYATDLVLLRDDDHAAEFERALTLFPQYGEYVPTETVY